MIEITLENLLMRMDSLNKSFFNFGSKNRIYVIPIEVSPNSYLKGEQFEIRKYNIDEIPIVSTLLKMGDKSEVFNYQQAVFDTLKMLEIEKKGEKKVIKRGDIPMNDKNGVCSNIKETPLNSLREGDTL